MILHIFALSVKWMMFKNSCKNIEKCRDMYRKNSKNNILFLFSFCSKVQQLLFTLFMR